MSRASGSRITISTTLRRADLFWMNQDSWSARGCFVAGLPFLLGAVISPDPASVAPYGLALIGLSLLVLPAYAMWLTRSFALTWQTVHLHFDDVGVRGWPRGDDDDRSWERAHRVWTRPGVIIIQFGRLIGSRGGRIVVPTRDIGPRQQESLWTLLVAKRLVHADRRNVLMRVLASLVGWVRSR